jgi:uridine phosphorylase
MSEGADQAYREGKVPASKIPGVPAKLVREFCGGGEWHHTSKFYSETGFYNPLEVRVAFGLEVDERTEEQLREDGEDRFEPNPAAIAALAAHKQNKPAAVVHENCTVSWLEWSGSRNHPRCQEREEAGCRVVIQGQTATVTLPSGKTMVKRLATREFKVSGPGGEVISGWWQY